MKNREDVGEFMQEEFSLNYVTSIRIQGEKMKNTFKDLQKV